HPATFHRSAFKRIFAAELMACSAVRHRQYNATGARAAGAARSHAMDSLTGQLLVAMPQMMDPRFARSVVYVCAHSEEDGAMGLVVNKLLASLTMDELMTHLQLEPGELSRTRPVHFGGPVEPGRGFVLHTPDYHEEA